MNAQTAALAANGSNRNLTDSGSGHNGNGVPSAVTDERQPPFCYQAHAALEAIRAQYAKPDASYGKLATALGVYLTITEAAARRACIGPDGFSMERACLAKRAGMAVETFDGYARSLEAAGVLGVVRTFHRPNRWCLLEVGGAEKTRGAEKTAHKYVKDLNPSSLPTVSSTPECFPEFAMSSNFEKPDGDVERVYEHWRKVCNKSRSNYQKVSPGRKQKILCRLKEFSVEELCRAIDGVARDPWNGRSLQNDLTIIFRSQEQVEKFLELAVAPLYVDGHDPLCKHRMKRGLTPTQLRRCGCFSCQSLADHTESKGREFAI